MNDDQKARMPMVPWDNHNQRLVANVHPLDWRNPTAASRYNLVVLGAGAVEALVCDAPEALALDLALLLERALGALDEQPPASATALRPDAQIFRHLTWAAYLKDWSGPAPGERPSAYIIILGDTAISHTFGCDHGIAAQSILLGAREKGLGGCIIGSIQRDRLGEILEIPPKLEILLVLALGRPREKVVLEEIAPGESIRYWRDEQSVHHVPKRRLEDIIMG